MDVCRCYNGLVSIHPESDNEIDHVNRSLPCVGFVRLGGTETADVFLFCLQVQIDETTHAGLQHRGSLQGRVEWQVGQLLGRVSLVMVGELTRDEGHGEVPDFGLGDDLHLAAIVHRPVHVERLDGVNVTKPFFSASGAPLMASPITDIRLGWKGLPRTNTLAYYEKS
jgi:hypothetical protein